MLVECLLSITVHSKVDCLYSEKPPRTVPGVAVQGFGLDWGSIKGYENRWDKFPAMIIC